MFLPVEIIEIIDEDGSHEIREIDINPAHIETIEPDTTYGDYTYIVFGSGYDYLINMSIGVFRKVLEQAQLKTLLS